MTQRILLTGGAGFIGSHTAVELVQAGYQPVIVDNFSNAQPSVLDALEKLTGQRLPCYRADIRDQQALEAILEKEAITAVIHFAGLKAVGESVEKPVEYYDNNVGGSIALLKAMKAKKVNTLIFSSSSTVYGNPEHLPLTEESPLQEATNPYGQSKLMIEKILKDTVSANPTLSFIALRYFNPIGAHPSGLIGENPNGIPNNLMPYIARVAHGRLKELQVFGNDYPTPDGTGVRDYIHVVDLARGHVKALDYALNHEGWKAINLGCGKGYSVLEVVKAFEKASGKTIPYRIQARRAGDIAANWADPSLAKTLLGWEAQYDIEAMCRDAWNFENQRTDE